MADVKEVKVKADKDNATLLLAEARSQELDASVVRFDPFEQVFVVDEALAKKAGVDYDAEDEEQEPTKKTAAKKTAAKRTATKE